MNTRIILAALGIAILVGGAFWLGTAQNAEAPMETTDAAVTEENTQAAAVAASTTDTEVVQEAETSSAPTPTKTQAASTPAKPAPAKTSPAKPTYAVIVYDGQNYSPNEVTINLGGTVKFVNGSDKDMWIASDIHPIHSGYQVKDSKSCSGWAFDMCKTVGKGGSWSFTFEKAGKFGFHNHVDAADGGRVIVIDPAEKPSIPGY